MENDRTDLKFLMDMLKDDLMEEGVGLTVKQKIESYEQPEGGLLEIDKWEETFLEDERVLHTQENMKEELIELAVKYLTRFILTEKKREAFKISLLGAQLIQKEEIAEKLFKNITGLDDESLTSSVQLVGFDIVYQEGFFYYEPVENILPDKKTLENMRILVERSLEFFNNFGPVIQDGFSFPNVYTEIIVDGQGGFLTKDTLWGLTTKKDEITTKDSLEQFLYWRLGLRSDFENFKNIKNLGIFNPRKNKIYKIKVEEISDDRIKKVDLDVIGYEEVL